MRIALLSTDGRQDIVAGFIKFSERNWPDRKWPFEVIAGDPEGSYSQRIISYLKSVPDEVLMTTRMHLNRKQVAKLLPVLQKFVDTGEI